MNIKPLFDKVVIEPTIKEENESELDETKSA